MVAIPVDKINTPLSDTATGAVPKLVAESGDIVRLEDSQVTIATDGTVTSVGDFVAFQGTAAEVELGEEVLETSSTGIITWDSFAVNNSTSVTVGAGIGHIADNFTNPPTYTFTKVSWILQNVTITNAATPGVTYLYVDNAGVIQQKFNVPLTPLERQSNIFLGRAIHTTGAVTSVQPTPDYVPAIYHQFRDLLDALGLLNKGVGVAGVAATLSIQTSGGVIIGGGINALAPALVTNPAPNDVEIAAVNPIPFRYISSSGGAAAPDITLLTPNVYEGGTVGGGSQNSTLQRVWLFPSGNWRIQYGPTIYPTLAEAIQAVSTETFTPNPFTVGNAVLVATIAISRTCTSTTDTATCRILPAGLAGQPSIGGAGFSVSTLQQAYTNQAAAAQLVTDNTRFAVKLRQGSGSNSDNLLEGRNGADSVLFAVRGDGRTTLAKLTVPDSGTTPPFNLTFRSTAPSSPATSDIYPDDGSNTASGFRSLRRWNGSTWQDIGPQSIAQLANVSADIIPGRLDTTGKLQELEFVRTGTPAGANNAAVPSYAAMLEAVAGISVDLTTLAFNSSSPVTMFTLPSTAVVHLIEVIVRAAWDTAATASVGITGNTAKYLATTDIPLRVTGRYPLSPGLPVQGADALIITYVQNAATVGSADFFVHYSVPS